MPPASWLQLAVGIVALLLMGFTWWNKKNDATTKKQDQIDKDIDNASSFDDFVRIDDELPDK